MYTYLRSTFQNCIVYVECLQWINYVCAVSPSIYQSIMYNKRYSPPQWYYFFGCTSQQKKKVQSQMCHTSTSTQASRLTTLLLLVLGAWHIIIHVHVRISMRVASMRIYYLHTCMLYAYMLIR